MKNAICSRRIKPVPSCGWLLDSRFDNFEFSPRVSLRLKLPRLSQKAFLIISRSDDDDFDAEKDPISRYSCQGTRFARTLTYAHPMSIVPRLTSMADHRELLIVLVPKAFARHPQTRADCAPRRLQMFLAGGMHHCNPDPRPQ